MQTRALVTATWLSLGAALSLAGCGLETRVETEVPARGPRHCGALEFGSEEDPPYPPTSGVDEDRLRDALRKAAADNGVPANQVEAEVDRIMKVLEEPTTYGVVAASAFTSHEDADVPRVRCPRFVQLVRSRLKVKGSVTISLNFSQLAQRTPWVQTGGTPTGEGWGVDRVQRGANPVFGDDDLPGVFQYWSRGTTRLVDVPGISTPWSRISLAT